MLKFDISYSSSLVPKAAFWLLVVLYWIDSTAQITFNSPFQLEENTAQVIDNVLAIQDTLVIATADLCGINTIETSCIRFMKLLPGEGGLTILEDRLYDFGVEGSKPNNNYFVSASGGGYWFGYNLDSEWRLYRISHTLDTLWSKSYNQSGMGQLYSISETNSGDVLLAGADNPSVNVASPRTTCVNSTGDVLWNTTFPIGASSDDAFYAVTQGQDNQYVMSGFANYAVSWENDHLADGYIARVDSAGNVLQKVLVEGLAADGSDDPDNPFPAGVLFYEKDEFVQIFSYLEEGYVYRQNMANYFGSDPFQSIGRVARLDKELNTVWEYRFDYNPRRDLIRNLVVLEDGSIVGCGKSENGPTWGSYAWLFKLSADGELLWNRIIAHPLEGEINTHNQFFRDIVETSDGDIVAVGAAKTAPQDYFNYWIVKVDSDGCIESNCVTETIYTGLEDSPSVEANSFYRASVSGNIIRLQFDQALALDGASIIVSDLNGRVLQTAPLSKGTMMQELTIPTGTTNLVLVTLTHSGSILQSEKLLRF